MYNPETSDPNDPVKISFTCTQEEFEDWVEGRIEILKEYDESFYIMRMSTMSGTIYYLHTTAKHLEHDEFKRFLFQVKLKFGEEAKIR